MARKVASASDWSTEVRVRRRTAAMKIRKKKVNVLHHARDRMLLPCSYATFWGLHLDLLSGPGSAPLPLGLAGRAMGARRWWDAVAAGLE